MSDTNQQQAKMSPHSIAAEQSLLGSFLIAGDSWSEEARDRLRPEDFYRPGHQHIFRAICQVVDEHQPVDVLVLTEKLKALGALEQAGSAAYLVELAESTIGAEQVVSYADIIVSNSKLRQLLAAAQKIAATAYATEGKTADEIVDQAEQLIFSIAEQSELSKDAMQSADDLLTRALERIRKLAEAKGKITGLSTGFEDIDQMTDGLHEGELVIVAGRPSMGKTSFAINIAEHLLTEYDDPRPVYVFSLEMPSVALMTRSIASLSRIDQRKVRTGTMSEDDWARLGSTVMLLREKPLYIDDSAAMSPGELRRRCRRLSRELKQPMRVIIVDYLQLMRSDRRSRDENRVAEISEISRSLKALAKEMNCPVIALSQLNRGVEGRPNKRPLMSDLRESGAIEQDADLIMFIYRDVVYNPETEDQGVAEIIIGKQRNGPIGTCRLAFFPEITRFELLSKEDEKAVPAS